MYKVLFLTNIPSPYRMMFFNELGKQCDLTVVFEGLKATDRDIRWKYEKAENFRSIYLKGIRTKSDQFFCPGIIKILRKKFDYVIVGGYSTPTGMLAIEYMRLTRKAFFIEADGGLIYNDNSLKLRLKRHFISAASGWLSSGKATTEYFVHYGADVERIYTYPFTSLREEEILDGVPTVEEKKELRKLLGLAEKNVVISVGRFIECKGFDILMHAATKLDKGINIYIIGDKPQPEYLKYKEENLLCNVHFIDFMSKNELLKYYQAADVFVLPTRGDVWGLVINEAMANGLPIVTTNRCVAGLELVEDAMNGFIVQVDNVDELKSSIEKVLNQDTVWMGENSLHRIQKYTIENMASEHIRIMERLA